MKTMLKLDEILKEEKLPKEIIDFIEQTGALKFLDRSKLEEVKDIENITGGEYRAAKIDLAGKEYGIVMKGSLSDAILDPSGDDADLLREAGRTTIGALKKAFGKQQLKPLESNFEQTLFDKYLSSLLMNLVRYPSDELNSKTLRELGVYNSDVSKQYVNAAAAWLGTSEGLEGIVKQGGVTSHLQNIGYTGKGENVDLSVQQCHSGSHYVLKANSNKKQISVQVNAPELEKAYQEAENNIVYYIQNHATSDIVKGHARNLVRLYLNLTALYKSDKPLPLEWK